MNDNISDKDKKDWQTFISSKEKILDKDFKPQIKNHLKVRSIDLHGYTLEQANNAIEKFILKSFQEYVNKLIVVTGKGIHSNVEKDPYVSKDLSILKYSVPEFINNNQNLMRVINDIQDATIEDGGSGAFYVLLKKNKSIK
ncbi:Smr/MutS family protein [Candidatus Pelagibacter sp. HIMB1542]|uniref:Smr/MutS family protein n=1 Tax=Candidatus Pelagibacter sp. HIMB1542 TaxID=3413346 RepID=UPI003F836C3B